MNKLKIITISSCLVFWPLSLFLSNISSDFARYAIPAFLVALSFFLLKYKVNFYPLPLIAIPFIEPKLAVFPLIVVFVIYLLDREKRNLIFALFSLLVLFVNWKPFWGQTIFQPDYEAQQEVISKGYLYPTVETARFFQNKPRIFINKFNNNFFTLVDPNNYFFNFHPREILIDNQNLNKFPFLGIIFLLFGFYYLGKHEYCKFVVILLVGSLLSLSILQIFDRNDFLLWLPLSVIIIHGINNFKFKQKKMVQISFAIFLIFTIPELIRIFLR